MTITSCLLIADWQAIPYDQCTEYSPFHNPGKFTSSADNFSSISWIPSEQMTYHLQKGYPASVGILTQLSINPSLELFFSSNQTINNPLQASVNLSCHVSEECRTKGDQVIKTLQPLALRFIIEEDGRLELDKSDTCMLSNDEHEFLACGTNQSICIQLHKHLLPKEQLTASLYSVQTQSLLVLKPVYYNKAMFNCVNANVTSHDCYWNPYSIITRRHCKDCQPLCRSRSHSLTFAQFVIGSAILVASIPVAWVPVAALVSNRVAKESQVNKLCISCTPMCNMIPYSLLCFFILSFILRAL